MKSVGIIATGSYVPSKKVTNFDLMKTIDTSDEWIYSKLGIKERRIKGINEDTSDLAVKASKKAIKNASIDPLDIDLIIVATSTPNMTMPSTACIVQGRLGAKNAVAFDINAVCSGFVYALSIGSKFISDSTYKTVLVIGAEALSKILNWEDRGTCVLFGDGAGAVILKGVKEGYGILASHLKSDGTGKDIIKCPNKYFNSQIKSSNPNCFQMDGKKVWDFALLAFPKAVKEVVKEANLNVSDIDFLISHQANINIINKSMKLLNLPLDKTFTNIHKYGNIAGASIPIALDEAVSAGKVKHNDILVLVGYGSGLTYGANLIRWCDNKKMRNNQEKNIRGLGKKLRFKVK